MKGLVSIIIAYTIWGLLPIYWKWVQAVPPDRMLANRIVWSFIFVCLYLVASRKFSRLQDIRQHRSSILLLCLAGIIMSINWFTYLYAVNTGQMIAGSLGYYINPLVSIALGAIVFRERFHKMQVIAIMLAAIGVAVMGFTVGKLPWISLILAFTFAAYGLIKKMIPMDSTVGLLIETGIVTPVALIYLVATPPPGLVAASANAIHRYPAAGSPLLLFLIPMAGVVTAVPLMLFATGARHLDLSMVGFLQYIAPTLMLLLGVFVYREPFTLAHAVCFGLIWMGLILYTGSKLNVKKRFMKKRKTISSAHPPPE